MTRYVCNACNAIRLEKNVATENKSMRKNKQRKNEANIDLILMRGLKLKRDTRRMFASLLCSYFTDDSMIFAAHAGTAHTHPLHDILVMHHFSFARTLRPFYLSLYNKLFGILLRPVQAARQTRPSGHRTKCT